MKKTYRYSKKNKVHKRERAMLKVAIGLGVGFVFVRDTEEILSGLSPSLSSILYGTLISLMILFIPKIAKELQSKKHSRDYKNSTLYQIDKMDGIGFERYLKWLFEQRGFKAMTTSTTGDFGADLLLKKDGLKVVVQAKRYGTNVGIQAIQEVFTAKHYYDCDEAWVVTNSRFTKSAKLVGDKVNVRLIGRDELETFVNTGKKEESIESFKIRSVKDERLCPKCAEKLVLRQSGNGEFFGCTSYPSCKHTEKI